MSTESPAALPPIPGSVPLMRNADTAPAYWMVDVLWMVLADGNDTGGRFSMMEQLLPKGSGPGPHKHTWSDETFYARRRDHPSSRRRDQDRPQG